MNSRRLSLPRSPRRRAIVALFALGLSYVLVMQALGWAQTSYFAQVKSLAEGSPTIDRHHWETRDISWFDGHFYSVKAPGLAFVTLPLYAALKDAAAPRLAEHVAASARRHGQSRWHPVTIATANYGHSLARGRAVQATLERQSPLVWALGLLGSVLPAILLLFTVRWAGDRLVPGYGLAAAVTLGSATLILPFASQYFGHVLAATLAFGAFALALRERAGPPRPWLLAGAGLLAGYAVTTEYPLAIAAALVGAYAVLRAPLPRSARARRALAYGAGGALGAAPLAAYNVWAFGTLWHNSYEGAVKVGGFSGHAVLGLNDGGFFGIGVPNPWTALELLFSARGLLTIAPVLALAAWGLVELHRGGRREEALLAGAIALAYLAYDSGYWTPFGGGTPGPRFLIPILPFLALGLAAAWRSRPALVAALTGPSVLLLLVATLTRPLIGDADSAGAWSSLIGQDIFANTLFSAVGLGNGWPEALPSIACVMLALGIALPRGVRVERHELVQAGRALALWFALACCTPVLWGAPAVITGDFGALTLFVAGVLAGVALLAALVRLGRDTAGALPADWQPVEKGAIAHAM